MLIYPTIDPVAFSLGPLKVHWYGLMYLLAFLTAWGLAVLRSKRYQLAWTNEQVSDLIFYGAVGVIAGGRLGYMLFYATEELIFKPWILFKLWDGGMSFHGGLLGVILAMYLYGRKIGKTFWQVADFTAPIVPIGLAFGRVGNFINGELWGRVTDMPWGMVFFHVDANPRHPSQIYEFLLEGVVLFIAVWIYAAKPRPDGRVSALFLILYGIFRFIIEFFRQPDPQLGFIALGWVSMGQLLSLPMILFGIWIWYHKKNNT